MLQKLKDRFTISLLNSLLTKYDTATASYETQELNAGKRIIATIAGVYILQKGIRNFKNQPFLAFEEIILGSVFLYNAAAGLNSRIVKKPVEAADIRRNQIQGNDPNSFVPAFV